MKNFIMLSGIPRSGSQVLSSLLNQHTEIHASTTSPVIDLICIVNDNWKVISQSLVDQHPKQELNILKGIVQSSYEHIDKPVIVDKNRLWPRYSKLMQDSLGIKPKIICTVRPIPEILSSYILLIRKNKNKITFVDEELFNLKLPINDKNRCRILWEKYINHPYTSLRLGYKSPYNDLCFVTYDEIVNSSQETMDKICKFIGIESQTVNINSLQRMDENDGYHGGLEGLHDVRSVMKKTSGTPEEIIGKELTQLYTNMKLDFWRKP
jgi:sulfotransferase